MIYGYFTTPDPSIIQESSIDPLGLEPLWTDYGQRIFENKITSVANDARAFTINAFHHYVLQRLFSEHDTLINETRVRFPKGWGSITDVKSGLLIFLENLMTLIYCMEKDSQEELDTTGILGLIKGNAVYRREGREKNLVASRTEGILKNQINLGFTGRYKNPMILMQFFNSSFEYLPDPNGTWKLLNHEFDQWPEIRQFGDDLLKLLVIDLMQHNLEQRGRNAHPEIILRDLMSTKRWKPVRDGYLKIFGQNRLPNHMKKFWRSILGFDSCAAGALFKMIDTVQRDNNPGYYEKVCRKALATLKDEPIEAIKIQNILDIEPFLSHVEYLTRYLSHPTCKKLKESMEDIKKLKNAIAQAALTIPENTTPALKQLKKVFTIPDSTDDWLKQVHQYHKRTMEKRGGQAWFEFDNQLNVRHFFSPSSLPGGNDIDEYLNFRPWLHTYYLDTLRNLKNGLK